MRHATIFFRVLVIAACGLAAHAGAQLVQLPPAPRDAVTAEADFDKRAAAITRFNACGREIAYSKYRQEFEREEFADQKENFPTILIAKLAWLTDPRYANVPCEYETFIPRTDPAVIPADFAKAQLEGWADPSTPTRCSFETSETSFDDRGLLIRFRVSPACLKQQVNEGLRAMQKDGKMGSSDIPCAETFSAAEGDFDVVVRDVVRILYMGTLSGRQVLEPETLTHMWENLLAARGGLSPDDYSMIGGCHEPAGDELGTPEDFADREYWYEEFADGWGDFWEAFFKFLFWFVVSLLKMAAASVIAPFYLVIEGDVEAIAAFGNPFHDPKVKETENHRLMIESSKYLTNAAILRHLRAIKHDNISEIDEKQTEVRTWLLKTLQRIAREDFEEYNSRPYTRYSLISIQNLYDFSRGDLEMKAAAQIVLDLSAAKFAAASNRGRRIVPFRRLADAKTFHLYEFFNTADHEAVRAVTLYGQTQLIPHGVDPHGATMMIFDAVSSYRAPRPVVEVAVERKAPFQQTVKHWGVEGYFSTPSFTMSLGGVPLPAAISLYGQERDTDRGVAVPTVLIPTAGGLTMEEVFGFAGGGTEHGRMANLCGWKGFVCGIEPIVSKAFPCDPLTINDEYVFVSSARCADKQEPHFYLALRRFPCQPQACGPFFTAGLSYGFMEMVDAPPVRNDAHFSTWVARRIPAMRSAAPDASGVGTYRMSAGDVIRYQIEWDLATILDVNGFPRPNFATRGAVLESDGAGRAVIRSPWSGSRIEIDFTDWQLPRRRNLP